MFRRVLIANRGEIACRIIRTCRRLGIETVAVHSTADRGALHVALADHAVLIGEAAPALSYLDGERVIEAAKALGADAIHPGYGFLSENADFAAAVAAAGLVFVGPPPAAIRAMGAKDEAKRLMAAAGVPCVPGYAGQDVGDARLQAEAERIGYPLLVKAAAGGGGKGMRVVEHAADLAPALAAARREALAAFGSDRVILERYLERPRHIEAQVLADGHGRTLFLFERECTLQRRHQKVIEEAPSPTLDDAARTTLGAVAVRAAAAVGYVNAGTVEFLYADGQPYFIEMNTRLQVEHPVTELVTGLDLVEWQLRIAAGEALPFGQDDLALDGHAIEARLYAEDPSTGFLPSTGRLHVVRWPEPSPCLRVETGVQAGDEVGLDYDPMLAKLAAHGPDRATALARLRQALGTTRLVGVTTNRGYLQSVLADPAVQANQVDTTWLERKRHHPPPGLPADARRLAVADRLAERAERAAALAEAAGDAHGPWQAIDGFRLGRSAAQLVRLAEADRLVELTVTHGPAGWQVDDGDRTQVMQVLKSTGDTRVEVDGRRITGLVVRDGPLRWVATARGEVRFRRVPLMASDADEGAAEGTARAPMPGRIVEVAVAAGDTIERGTLLVKLEAMKMEHHVVAEVAGRVCHVAVGLGDQVAAGATLVELAAGEGAT
ncbi:MAG: ATP-grasp domain-containing protein [Geminicoccaceae bacterium]|nr:MAG: ATP-grasp domain-containing protein [Geminicoccaceae bacterium]